MISLAQISGFVYFVDTAITQMEKKMSDAYRAGKFHAESDQKSNLSFYTVKTFAWFDYLEGQRAGFNEMKWYHVRCTKDADQVRTYDEKLEAVKAILKRAGR